MRVRAFAFSGAGLTGSRGDAVTKSDFLSWLKQFRHVGNIRAVVEERAWQDDELDRLKETLESGGRLRMKNEFRRRQAWG